MTTRVFALALAAALLGSVPARALDEGTPPGEWTVLLAPSGFAPRLHGLDSALQYNGIGVIESWLDEVTGDRGDEPRGIGRIYWGFGGRVAVGYQINEDIRAGVLAAFDGVWQSGSRPDLERFEAIAPGSTTYLHSGTWTVTEKLTLPVGKIGVFLHKVFTFEEEPDLRLFLGGFGELGTLIGGRLKMDVIRTDTDPVQHSPATLDVTGQGYGGGGTVGLELALAAHTSLLAEAGYEAFRIPRPQVEGTLVGYTTNLQDGGGRDISLDFSGWYLKIGTLHRFGPRR